MDGEIPPEQSDIGCGDASVDESEVEKLLKQIGRKIGKSDEEMQPYIVKLVKENWLDTEESLRGLREWEWIDLNLPKRLLSVLRASLASSSLPSSVNINGSRRSVSSSTSTTSEPPRAAKDIPHTNLKQNEFSTTYEDVGFCETSMISVRSVAGQAPPDSPPEDLTSICLSNPSNRSRGPLRDVASFVESVGTDLHRSAAQIDVLKKRIIDENWIETLEQLYNLSDEQWALLQLPLIFVDAAKRRLTAIFEDDNSDEDSEDLWSDDGSSTIKIIDTGPSEVEELLTRIGQTLGRSKGEMQKYIDVLVNKNRMRTVAALRMVPDNILADLHLPVRLITLIRTETERSSPPTSPPSQVITPFPSINTLQIREFLVKVGSIIGRSEDEMEPFIQKFVSENWFDSLDYLRRLSDAEWLEFQIPKRLLDAIKDGLYDPEVLEFSTVFYAEPDPDIFPSTVAHAVARVQSEIPYPQVKETVRSLLKLMETIVSRPQDTSKRRIKKSNMNFDKRAGRYKSATLLLQAVGYQDSAQYWLLPVAYMNRLTEAHGYLAHLAVEERHGPKKGLLRFLSSTT